LAASYHEEMGFSLPHIEKFVSPWLCAGIAGFGLAAFIVVLFVLATHRRRDEDAR
jgi:hypothetical protein